MAQKRFYLQEADVRDAKGTMVRGWKVYDRLTGLPAKGTAGGDSRPGGYTKRSAAQAVSTKLNDAHTVQMRKLTDT